MTPVQPPGNGGLFFCARKGRVPTGKPVCQLMGLTRWGRIPQRVAMSVLLLSYARRSDSTTPETLTPVIVDKPGMGNEAGYILVIDTAMVPPTVLSAYPSINYPFFGGLLPEQFIDHRGNLRGADGRIIFAGSPGEDPSHAGAESKDAPHRDPVLGSWAGTTGTSAMWGTSLTTGLRVDLADHVSILEPEDTPVTTVVQKLKNWINP